MIRSRFLSCTLIPLYLGLLFVGTGCSEHKKVAAQTKEIREKVEELKAVREAKEQPGSVQKNPLTRKGSKTLQAMISMAESDIKALEERQKVLEAELVSLQKSATEYRAKHF